VIPNPAWINKPADNTGIELAAETPTGLIHLDEFRVGDRVRWRWAARWWRYDEAVQRLEVPWRAREHLRQHPALGMGIWWRDRADPHMAALLDPNGPFADVDGEENVNKRGEPLPYKAPPPGLFPDVRAPQ